MAHGRGRPPRRRARPRLALEPGQPRAGDHGRHRRCSSCSGRPWWPAEVYEAVVENDGLAALDEPVLEAAVGTAPPERGARHPLHRSRWHRGDAGHRRRDRPHPRGAAALVVARRAHAHRGGRFSAHHRPGQGPHGASAAAGDLCRATPGDLAVVPVGAHPQRDRGARAVGLPRHARSSAPAQQAARRLGRRRVRRGHGAVTGVAGAPLAHRRHGRAGSSAWPGWPRSSRVTGSR